MIGVGWIDELRTRSLEDVAAGSGLALEHSGMTPCPSCGAERRGSSDARAPVGLTHDRAGWRCHRCGAGGDVVSLAAVLATGETKPTVWGPVRAWASSRGLCSGDGSPAPVARPLVRDPPPPPPRRPPASEVLEVWNACQPVTADAEVAHWLSAERGLDAAMVDDLDLGRALPKNAIVPAWARSSRRPWSTTGHRFIVPTHDSTGAIVSLRARAIATAKVKELAPLGFEVRDSVMADSLGALLLAGGKLADGSSATAAVRAWGLLLAEGVPDYLTGATLDGDAREDAPARIGYYSGAWSAEIAARVPDGTVVTIAAHDDAPTKAHPHGAGVAFAEEIAATLRDRCPVRIAVFRGRAIA